MNEQFSNLEVAARDAASQAPELVSDREALAPERDLSAHIPEVDEKQWQNPSPAPEHRRPSPLKKNSYNAEHAPETGTTINGKLRRGSEDLPETGDLDGSFPQDAPNREGLKDAAFKHQDRGEGKKTEQPHRRRGLLVCLLVGLGVLVALVIALGVGLGVGLKKKKGSTSSSTNTGAPVLPETLPHGVQNNSALAVVSLPTGDKRFFFQENSGTIREALFSNSTQQWDANTDIVVATNAKNSTPIVSLLSNGTGTSPGVVNTIYLIYIADNNQLASRIFVSGTWTTRDNFSPSSQRNATYMTSPNSRALAITASAGPAVNGAALVFYVTQNGTIECLSITPDSGAGIVANSGPALPQSMQGDHVLALAAGVASYGGKATSQVGVLLSNGTSYYNLFFSFLAHGSWSKPALETVLVPPLPPAYQPNVPKSLTLANAYPVSTTATATSIPTPSSLSAAYNETLIGDVNIAQVFVSNPGSTSNSNEYTLFGFWVNGTDLAAYTTKNIGLSGEPNSEFPFSRLAGTNVGSEVFLYHQINGTSVAQDVYNSEGGFFSTKYFQVDT